MPPTRQLVKRTISPRRKINLIRKALVSSTNNVWYICKRQNEKMFYLVEFDDDKKTALWSPHTTDGLVFHTEAGVNKFITAYLKSIDNLILVQKSS